MRDTSYWDFNRKLESPTPTTNRSSRGRVLCPIDPYKYNYNPRQKSWHTCPLLQHLSGKFITEFIPLPRFNVVYRDEFVIARFQHCLGGGRGVSIPVMSLLIVSTIACQSIFMLSDIGRAKNFCRGLYFESQLHWRMQTDTARIYSFRCVLWIRLKINFHYHSLKNLKPNLSFPNVG